MTLLSPQSGLALSERKVPAGYVTDRHNTVYLSNKSTALGAQEFADIAWSLQYQVDWQFGPAWQISSRILTLGSGVAVPSGAIVISFTDTLDISGALGYHDESGNEVPYAKVGVVTSRDDGAQPGAVASHELCELLADLHVNLTAINPANLQVVMYEVGDPCQGNDYDVGTPEGRPTGKPGGMVADFALQNWFDPNTSSTAKTSYRGALKGPFKVGPQGYHAYVDLNNAVSGGQVNWQQAFGQDHVNAGSPSVVNPE